MFGNWDLALAAYNAGEGTVQRAIDRNRKKGLPTDYASLSLPEETKNYVPKLQAIKNIMRKPEVYGLNIDNIPNRPYFTKVIAPEQIDAKLAASLAEISYEEFISLNPEYNRPVITETGSAHEILLPISAANTFNLNLANYDKPLVSWQTYHTKRGERMDKIAQKFGINVSQLRDVNDIPNGKKLNSAQAILVPTNSKNNNLAPIDINSSQATSFNGSTNNSQLKTHTIKAKQTLASIGRDYHVSVEKLMSFNQLENPNVKIGQVINIPTSDIKTQSSPETKIEKPLEKSTVTTANVKKISKKNKRTAKHASSSKKKRSD